MAPLKTTIFPMLEHSAQVLLEILGFPRLDIQFKATLPSSPGCLNQYKAEFLIINYFDTDLTLFISITLLGLALPEFWS